VGVPTQSGPEQDLLKHWISENGLSMRLIHKMIKSHGGSISAAGIAGSSVKIMIRLPHERVSTTGLIAPPEKDGVMDSDGEETSVSGLVFKTGAKTEKATASAG
jgi:hypothetical protein